MGWKNSSQQYGTAAKGLHWFSALIVLAMLPLGFYMVSLDFSPFKLDLYWWHKSFGTLVLLIVLLRLGWRFANEQPAPHENHRPWERGLAKTIHFLLYAGMIGMPLSGWLMTSAGDFTHSFFGIPVPHIAPKNETLFKAMRTAHELSAYALIAAVGLHGLGAFKHHFIDRDATLLRMLPAVLPRAGAVVAAALFVLALGGASALALRYEMTEGSPPAPPLAGGGIMGQAGGNILEQAEEITTTSPPASGGKQGGDSPQQWTIVPEQSSIGFKLEVQGAPFEGRFTQFDGEIFFDPDNPAQSRAEVRVKIASVATGSDERDEYIRAQPWLFAESFPESVFTTTRIEKTGDNQYLAHANLTMRGVSLPVEMPFTLVISRNGAETVADMKASFAINRLDFGIGTGEWSNPETVGISPVIAVSLHVRRENVQSP